MNQQELEYKVRFIVDNYNTDVDKQIIASMGLQFYACSLAEKTLSLLMEAKPWEMNPNKTMHGGVITTAMDTAMGYLAHSLSGGMVSTVSLTTNYIKPIVAAQTVLVKARAIRVGRTMIHMTSEIEFLETKTIAATAIAQFISLKQEF